MANETFREAVEREINVLNELGLKGDHWFNRTLASCGLKQDLGLYPETSLSSYDIDDITRDRLIAHARQDSAHALMNTKVIIERVNGLKTGLWLVVLLQLVLFFLIILALAYGVGKR